MHSPLWKPTPKAIQQSNLSEFIARVRETYKLPIESYEDLYQWSIGDPKRFWKSVWEFTGIIAQTRGHVVLDDSKGMESARFFPEARLNYAENLLKRQDDAPALIFWGEDQVRTSLSFKELKDQVAKIATSLRHEGIGPGDCVAGFVPNTPEALIAMLATASIGAVWASCSPDFGIQGALDRLEQINPRILFSADGYFYGGKIFNCLEKLKPLVEKLKSLERVVVFPYANQKNSLKNIPHAMSWEDFQVTTETPPLLFEQVPFNHPLFIMFSSGTTGKPKCIVHSVGGTLIEHLKEHQLHCDIKSGDRVFYFTTCGWMMWNWQVSALASGATLLLYDGSPLHPNADVLFDYADQEQMTLFGTAAKYIDAIAKTGLKPKNTHQLKSLKILTSTGSTLVPESFDYVYQNIKKDMCLASISGGTDILGCFVLGNPTAPVWKGEIQTRSLGLAVDVFDDQGHSLKQQKGELVCTAPFPSMPIGFWNDTDGKRYHDAYFSRFDNVWHHGDFVELTEHKGIIIYGRSDAVLNPGGVRIGTAEIYRQVEQFDEVLESIAVGQEWKGDVRIILFIKLRPGTILNKTLLTALKQKIRKGATPRHVPGKIIAVDDIPRTKSGKIVELAVRDVIHGRTIQNVDALTNPEALELYKDLPELKEE